MVSINTIEILDKLEVAEKNKPVGGLILFCFLVLVHVHVHSYTISFSIFMFITSSCGALTLRPTMNLPRDISTHTKHPQNISLTVTIYYCFTLTL
jgi:hypothetical protein